MKTLQIDESKAKDLYRIASDEFKVMLEDSFGKSFFSNDWMDLWEKFKKEYNLSVELPFSHPKTREQESSNAHHMLIHIIPIKRGKFEPDYNNPNQYKYEPRFNMTKSGFGFSDTASGRWHADTGGGSRLCSPTPQICEAIAVEFLPIYEKYTMYQK